MISIIENYLLLITSVVARIANTVSSITIIFAHPIKALLYSTFIIPTSLFHIYFTNIFLHFL